MITVFYDGQCGLCHRSVQFLLKRDPKGRLFRYATLQGETAEHMLPPRESRPDSVAIMTRDQHLLVRGDAAIHIGRALGGPWTLLSAVFAVFPRRLRDGLYNFVAQRRYAVFGTTSQACPIVSPEQRQLFLP